MDFVEGLFMAQGGSGLDFGHDPESFVDSWPLSKNLYHKEVGHKPTCSNV